MKTLETKYKELESKYIKLELLVFNLMISAFNVFEFDWDYSVEYIKNYYFENLLSEYLFDSNWGSRDCFVNAYNDMIQHFHDTDFIQKFKKENSEDVLLHYFMERYDLHRKKTSN